MNAKEIKADRDNRDFKFKIQNLERAVWMRAEKIRESWDKEGGILTDEREMIEALRRAPERHRNGGTGSNTQRVGSSGYHQDVVFDLFFVSCPDTKPPRVIAPAPLVKNARYYPPLQLSLSVRLATGLFVNSAMVIAI